jgi:tetratricopeptide (TPR) repeat protein
VKKPFLAAAACALLLATGARAESTDELNRRMMQLYGEGHYEEAIPLAQQVVTELEKSAGPSSREVASALNNEAELYNKLQRYAEAEPLYKRALAIRRAVLGPDDPDTMKSLSRLAALYHAEGKDVLPSPQQQQQTAQRPMPQPQQRPQPMPAPPPRMAGPSAAQQDQMKAMELNKQANELSSQGHFAEALPLAKESLAAFEKGSPGESANLAILLSNVAQIEVRLNHFTEAEPLYKRAVAILEKQPKGREGDLGLMYANLADMAYRQQHNPEAEANYRKALPLMEKGFGPDNENVKAVVNNFADMYRQEGKDPDNEPLLKGRWEKTARFSLPKSRNVAPDIAQHAEANPLDVEKSHQLDQKLFELMNQKKFAEALPVATEQQALLEKMYGPDNLAVALNLDNLAGIYRALGRDAEAVPLTKRSQTIRDGNRAVDQISR